MVSKNVLLIYICTTFEILSPLVKVELYQPCSWLKSSSISKTSLSIWVILLFIHLCWDRQCWQIFGLSLVSLQIIQIRPPVLPPIIIRYLIWRLGNCRYILELENISKEQFHRKEKNKKPKQNTASSKNSLDVKKEWPRWFVFILSHNQFTWMISPYFYVFCFDPLSQSIGSIASLSSWHSFFFNQKNNQMRTNLHDDNAV